MKIEYANYVSVMPKKKEKYGYIVPIKISLVFQNCHIIPVREDYLKGRLCMNFFLFAILKPFENSEA